MTKLTIGMAVFEDYPNTWSTLTALRMYHPEVLPDLELIVVDNAPDTPHGEFTKKLVENWVARTPDLGGAVYVPFREKTGTAAPRNHIFEIAQSDAVLCMDSHVMVEPEALHRLIGHYDEHPGTGDLFSGPLIYDDLDSASTHFEDVWRDEMWGTWGTEPSYEYKRRVSVETDANGDRRAKVSRTESPPFDIFAMGLGLFSCRRDSWLGFNEKFAGFGGEECYIHEKFRRAGNRCVCLPWLRWAHQFGRPGGIKYPLTVEAKFRNYVIGLTELGMDLRPALEHFGPKIGDESVRNVMGEFGLSPDELPDPVAVDPGAQPMTQPDPDQLVQAMMTQMQSVAQERDRLKNELEKAMSLLESAQGGVA